MDEDENGSEQEFEMSANRKNQSAAAYFGPVLKVVLLCAVICGASVGYVWQKSRILQLGQEIRQREARLKQLRDDNQKLADQLAFLRLPAQLDQRVKELKLGLGPTKPWQVVRLPEPPAPPEGENLSRQWAARQAGATTQ